MTKSSHDKCSAPQYVSRSWKRTKELTCTIYEQSVSTIFILFYGGSEKYHIVIRQVFCVQDNSNECTSLHEKCSVSTLFRFTKENHNLFFFSYRCIFIKLNMVYLLPRYLESFDFTSFTCYNYSGEYLTNPHVT